MPRPPDGHDLRFLTGISPIVTTNQPSYLAGWLKKRRNDRKLLIHAAAPAQHPADHVLRASKSLLGIDMGLPRRLANLLAHYFGVQVNAVIFQELLFSCSTTLAKPAKRSGLPSRLRSSIIGTMTLACSPFTSFVSGLPTLKS